MAGLAGPLHGLAN
jgi:citrate synthase